MKIAKNETGEKLVLALEGRLDTITAPELQKELLPELEGGKQVRMDFGRLVYVSSAGLRVLILGEKAAKAGGGKMTLANVLPDVMEIFEMTGLSEVLAFE